MGVLMADAELSRQALWTDRQPFPIDSRPTLPTNEMIPRDQRLSRETSKRRRCVNEENLAFPEGFPSQSETSRFLSPGHRSGDKRREDGIWNSKLHDALMTFDEKGS